VRLILFSGFLGAGKTVSILSASAYLRKLCRRVVILENEVGAVAYDEALLKEDDVEVRNLLAGCICCTLSLELVEELERIRREHAPDVVLFEPTGIAFPDRILKVVRFAGVEVESAAVVTIVDAERYESILKVAPHLAESQIAAADVLLISKTDLVTAERAAAVAAALAALNPKAPVKASPFGLPPGDAFTFWEGVFGG
jgi:G3E family GTPase